ncbi:MAG: hypothetical protein AAFV95_19795 [Bacteroidota bacterium]
MEMLFFKLLKANALLYSVILSGNINLVLKDTTYNTMPAYPEVVAILDFPLTEELIFEEVLISGSYDENKYIAFNFRTKKSQIYDEYFLYFGPPDGYRDKSYNMGGHDVHIKGYTYRFVEDDKKISIGVRKANDSYSVSIKFKPIREEED